MANTSAPVGGTITSGTFPNRDNLTFPDPVQEMRAQARQESAFARGETDVQPEYTRQGPDHALFRQDMIVNGSNRDRATAEADGTN